VTIYGLAEVSPHHFFKEIIPHFVREYIKDKKRVQYIAESRIAEITDTLKEDIEMIAFIRNLHAFCTDLNCYIATAHFNNSE